MCMAATQPKGPVSTPRMRFAREGSRKTAHGVTHDPADVCVVSALIQRGDHIATLLLSFCRRLMVAWPVEHTKEASIHLSLIESVYAHVREVGELWVEMLSVARSGKSKSVSRVYPSMRATYVFGAKIDHGYIRQQRQFTHARLVLRHCNFPC